MRSHSEFQYSRGLLLCRDVCDAVAPLKRERVDGVECGDVRDAIAGPKRERVDRAECGDARQPWFASGMAVYEATKQDAPIEHVPPEQRCVDWWMFSVFGLG